jgi:hypothetical protein
MYNTIQIHLPRCVYVYFRIGDDSDILAFYRGSAVLLSRCPDYFSVYVLLVFFLLRCPEVYRAR